MKTRIERMIEDNSAMWHLANDENYKSILHYMNDKNRKKLDDINKELAKYN
jgi:hypothetical protein